MTALSRQKQEFWDERAKLGHTSGSDDFMLKQIETDFIRRHIHRGDRVLDIGCGNGMTLIDMHETLDISGIGLDFSSETAALAQKNSEKYKNNLQFRQADTRALPDDLGQFDSVYVQRCLINLNSVEEQEKAFRSIMDLVKPGGVFIMVECTIDGQNSSNILRESLNISPLEIPWHNLFFYKTVVDSWQNDEYFVEHFDHISSTYHFLSRVVYAHLGEVNGGELKYDSDINKLALSLPPNIGDFGPVKGWVWRKK